MKFVTITSTINFDILLVPSIRNCCVLNEQNVVMYYMQHYVPFGMNKLVSH